MLGPSADEKCQLKLQHLPQACKIVRPKQRARLHAAWLLGRLYDFRGLKEGLVFRQHHPGGLADSFRVIARARHKPHLTFTMSRQAAHDRLEIENSIRYVEQKKPVRLEVPPVGIDALAR